MFIFCDIILHFNINTYTFGMMYNMTSSGKCAEDV